MKLRIYQKTAPGPVGTGVSADPGEFFVVDVESDLGQSFANSCTPNMYSRAVCVDGLEGVTVPDTSFDGDTPVNPLPVLNGEIGVLAVVRKGRARIFKTQSGRPEFMTAYAFQARSEEQEKLAEKCEKCEGECDDKECPKHKDAPKGESTAVEGTENGAETNTSENRDTETK